MDSIIGIDIGTTNTKAAAFDLSGQMLCFASRKTLIHHSVPEYSEFDANEIWGNVVECLSEIIENPACGKVSSICISSLGESVVLVNADGMVLYPIITWFDQRTVRQTNSIDSIIGKKEIYKITGQFLSPKFGLCKLLWIKDNAPEVLRNAHKCLSLHDFILFRLTGNFATEYSMASRMMCFDICKRNWSLEILSTMGIPVSLLPDAYPGSTNIGAISSSTAQITGLNVGTPVFTGGHDHACASIAANIFEDGVMLDSMGTSETTMVATDKIADFAKGFENQVCVYPHFGSKSYRALTSIQSCGATIEWFLRAFGSHYTAQGHTDSYGQLLSQMENSSPKNDSLIFLPYIRGLQENPHSRGAFIGIDNSCNRQSFIRAMFEGISFELKRRVESCEKVFDTRYDTIRCVGGPSKSHQWMRLKADITGKNVEVPTCNEAASLGAALLGAIGTGMIAEADLAKFYHLRATYKSNRPSSLYESRYSEFVNAQRALSGF